MPAVRGGHRLKRALQAGAKGGVPGVEIGFYPEQRYPNRKRVVDIARIQEYGGGTTPARPFMSTGLQAAHRDVVRLLRTRVNNSNMQTVLRRSDADLLGRLILSHIRRQIIIWSNPPNAPWTVRRKGFNNPLIESRLMLKAVRYRVLTKAEAFALQRELSGIPKPTSSNKRDVRGSLYAIGKLLGDISAFGGPSFTKLRSGIYTLAKGLGDVKAVQRGQVGERIQSRAAGRLASRGVGKVGRGGGGKLSGRLSRRVAGRGTSRGLKKVPRRQTPRRGRRRN